MWKRKSPTYLCIPMKLPLNVNVLLSVNVLLNVMKLQRNVMNELEPAFCRFLSEPYNANSKLSAKVAMCNCSR